MNHQNLEKKEKLLITTALEGLPDKGFEKIIFLGEWCRDYYKSSRFKNINFEVMPYPWDDRLLLEKDFQYLEGVYKKILKTLADNLNDYHKVKYPEKYWKIRFQYIIKKLSSKRIINQFCIEQKAKLFSI